MKKHILSLALVVAMFGAMASSCSSSKKTVKDTTKVTDTTKVIDTVKKDTTKKM